MTVVEAYLGGKKMDPYDNASAMCTSVTALLIEGIAHNTTGTVFMPEVINSINLVLFAESS